MPELPARMYHFVDAVNAAGVARDGLLSTTTLLNRQAAAPRVAAAVTGHRPSGLVLPTGVYVRDQSPMPPSALAPCLDPGLTPQDWYDLVNGHVFFWLDDARARRHQYALRTRTQLLLTLDARALAASHDPACYVTPFNIGNARRRPARRGRRTLVPLADWRRRGWVSEAEPGRRPRPTRHPPAELVVATGVPDVARYIVAAEWIPPW